jgi:hypothetical protein
MDKNFPRNGNIKRMLHFIFLYLFLVQYFRTSSSIGSLCFKNVVFEGPYVVRDIDTFEHLTQKSWKFAFDSVHGYLESEVLVY